MEKIVVYGADWCGDTEATRELLDELGVTYQYVNIEENEAGAQYVLDHNHGKRKLPTVDVGGVVLTVPEEDELEAALESKGFLPA